MSGVAGRAVSNGRYLGSGVDRGLKLFCSDLIRDFVIREGCEIRIRPCTVSCIVQPRNFVGTPKSVILYFRASVCLNASMWAVVGAVLRKSSTVDTIRMWPPGTLFLYGKRSASEGL